MAENAGTGRKLIYKKGSTSVEEWRIKLPHAGWIEGVPMVSHANGVAVVPIIRMKRGVYIMLIEEVRHVLKRGEITNQKIIEVPAGGPRKGETLEQTARRELMEEAGLEAKRLIKIGEMWSAPGWSSEIQYHFLAECKSSLGEQRQDGTESIERKLVSARGVKRMLKNREIKDLKTKGLLYEALDYLGML